MQLLLDGNTLDRGAAFCVVRAESTARNHQEQIFGFKGEKWSIGVKYSEIQMFGVFQSAERKSDLVFP